MAQTAHEHISVADYLNGEQRSAVRHEYLDGRVYAMVGASDAHGLITGNLFAVLHRHLRGSPCQVFVSDMKVRIKTATDERFYYPDLLVSCDAADRERFYRSAPCMVVEVLSDTTERLDRGEKFQAFRQLDSLQEYLLVSQDRPLVEVFRRATDWESDLYGAEDVVTLQSVGLELWVAAVYEDVDL